MTHLKLFGDECPLAQSGSSRCYSTRRPWHDDDVGAEGGRGPRMSNCLVDDDDDAAAECALGREEGVDGYDFKEKKGPHHAFGRLLRPSLH